MARVTTNNIAPGGLTRKLGLAWNSAERAQNLLMQHTASRDIAIVIGAGNGRWSLEMGKAFSHVVTFENDPALLARLRQSISRLKQNNIHISQGEADSHTSLDQTIRPEDLRRSYTVSAIRINADGREMDVLKAAVETIKLHHPSLLVTMNGAGKRYGTNPNDVMNFVQSLDYGLAGRVGHDYVFAPKSF